MDKGSTFHTVVTEHTVVTNPSTRPQSNDISEVQTLREHNKGLRAVLREREKDLENENNKITCLQRHIKDLQNELEEMRKKFYEEVNELSILNTQLELKVMRNHRAKEAIEKVEAEMERLKQPRRTVDRDMDIGQAPSVPTNSQKVSIGAMVTGQTVNQRRELQVLREENEALEAKFRELEKDLEIMMGMRLKLQGECAYLQGKFKSRNDTRYMKEAEISRIKLRLTEEATKNRILEEKLRNKNKELHRVKEDIKITQHAKRTVEENEVHGQKQQNCSRQVRRSEVQLDMDVGSGSFAEVWKGELDHTEVAVKKPIKKSDECVRKLFQQEIKIICQLQHPNVVRFIGTVVDVGEPPWIVLEYSGGSLHKLLMKRCLKPFEVLSFAHDAGSGLSYLHNHPDQIFHQDIHTDNLLIFQINTRPGNKVKLCDFGSSIMANDQRALYLNSLKVDLKQFGKMLFFIMHYITWLDCEKLEREVREELQKLINWCTKERAEFLPHMQEVVEKLTKMKELYSTLPG